MADGLAATLRYSRRVIFKRVGDGRPYPDHGMSSRAWADVPPRQVRLDELVTTKDTLQLAALLDEDSTFYGDLFAHVVEWRGRVYLEDGLHRALRAALQQRNVLHARVSRGGGLRATAGVRIRDQDGGHARRARRLLVVGGVWGWTADDRAVPRRGADGRSASTAVRRPASRGPRDQVDVSVFNAGDREGLAGRTMEPVHDEGFGEATSATRPRAATVAGSPRSGPPTRRAPRCAWSRAASAADTESSGATRPAPASIVVVGDDFESWSRAERIGRASRGHRICSPPRA